MSKVLKLLYFDVHKIPLGNIYSSYSQREDILRSIELAYFWYPTSNPNGVLGYLLLIYIVKVPQNGVPIIDQ